MAGGCGTVAAPLAAARSRAAVRPEVSGDMGSLAAQMASGRLTSQTLTRRYLDRIQALDRAGPSLRAVIETNPQALDIAAALDRERAARGVRGPLHGMPILIKDNIETSDRMMTTAG